MNSGMSIRRRERAELPFRMRKGQGGNHAEAFAFVVDYGKMLSSEQYRERKHWCRDHCESDYGVYYKRAGFASEADATLFLMRWS